MESDVPPSKRQRTATGSAVSPPLLHVVALKFRPELTDEEIERHFEEEVALTRRVPGLVRRWSWSKNLSLVDRADKNHGMEWVVVIELDDEAALAEYLPHPEHMAVKKIQKDIVVDIIPLDFFHKGLAPPLELSARPADAKQVLLHVVALKFRPELTDEEIERHFEEEVALARRMPELVRRWSWGKNLSLLDRADKNRGMKWIVAVELDDEAALAKYLPHPEHLAVKNIQKEIVIDIVPLDLFHKGLAPLAESTTG